MLFPMYTGVILTGNFPDYESRPIPHVYGGDPINLTYHHQ